MRNKAAPKGSDLSSNKAVTDFEDQIMLEDERARTLDELALYDEMTIGVLSGIKKDLAQGLSAEQILEKYAPLAAARVTSIALTEADSGKALAAAKDILDRSKGKAVERKQITHHLERLDERQVDAILLSELEGLELGEAEAKNEEGA